jgi:integrase
MQAKPRGLKLRGDIWWIDKIVKSDSGQRVTLRESTQCRALSDAVVVLDRRQLEVQQQAIQTPLQSERLFLEAAAEYVIDMERRNKSSERMQQDLRYLLPEIGHLPLTHVHQRTLQPWIDRQQGKLSSGTVGRAIATVATILKFASEVLRDEHKPWLPTAPPRFSYPDWGSRQRYAISWGEQDRLVSELAEHLIAPTLFAVYTGARHEEVVSLRWEQTRELPKMPKWSVWWIPPEVRKSNSSKRTSDQEGRFVVANQLARDVISGQEGLNSEYVFPSPRRDGRMYGCNNIGFREAVKRAGLTIRFHDLRHTFGDRSVDAGIPIDIRRSLLGHTHRDITQHYSRPGLLRLLEEAERIIRPESQD